MAQDTREKKVLGLMETKMSGWKEQWSLIAGALGQPGHCSSHIKELTQKGNFSMSALSVNNSISPVSQPSM